MMSKRQEKEDQGLFTGRHMAMVIGGFFGVIIAVNMVLVYFSSTSWTGLVVKNGYVASQNFNRKVAAQERFAKAGWAGDLDYGEGKFSFELKVKGEPLSGCVVFGKLGRPVHEGDDHIIEFISEGPGIYKALETLEPGRWVLQLEAACEPETASFVQRYRFSG